MKRKFRTIIDDDGNVEVYDESGNLIKTMKLSEADRARLLKAEETKINELEAN